MSDHGTESGGNGEYRGSDEHSAEELVTARGRWRIRRVQRTGSTNRDLAEAARSGVGEGAVLVAGYQTAGRGRLTRGWSSPPGAGLTFSVLLRPEPVPVPRWGWLSMLAGLAVVDAVDPVTGVPAQLKWPNDVLVADRKLCGILSEVITGQRPGDPAAVVIGIGLNVASDAEQLPPTGTSVSIVAGRQLRPDDLLPSVLERLAGWYEAWHAADGDAERAGVRAAYRERSATFGRSVTVQLAGERTTGEAVDVDEAGRLVLRRMDGTLGTFGSGDVIHATLE